MLLTFSKRSTSTPLLILLGQSNAVGVAPIASAPAEYQGAINGATIWNGSAFVGLVAGTTNQAADASSFGPELSLCRQAINLSGASRVLLVKHAVSNTSLAVDWLAPSGTQLVAAKAKIDAALATLTAGTYYIAGFVWVQGENDALSASATPSNNYQTNLTALISNLRTAYGASIPFITVQLGYLDRNLYYYQDNVRHKQYATAAAVSNVRVAQTDDLGYNADVIHYNAPAQISIGSRAAGGIFSASSYIENVPPAYSEITYWLDPSTPNVCLNSSNAIVSTGSTAQTMLGRQVSPLCNITNATSLQQPTITASVINGRQSATFDGTNDNLSAATINPSLLFGTTAGTIILVSKVNANKAQAQMFINAGTNAIVQTATRWDLGGNTYNYFFDWSNQSGGRINGTSAAVVGETDVHEFVKKSTGTSEIYRNQTQVANTASSGTIASLTGSFRIGFDGTNYFNGTISEVIVYPRVLTADERAQLYTYINNKYGI